MATTVTPTRAPAADRQTDLTVRPDGAAVAAMLAVGIGGLLMAIVVGISDANKAFEANVIHAIGKAWVPGAQGIGPYSGKFTVFLLGWLVSWAILHFALKGKDLDLSKWTIVSLVLIGVAILMVWPPITLGLFVR